MRSLYDHRLLEDCRHNMLSIPPKLFDEISAHVPTWRTVLNRLDDALKPRSAAHPATNGSPKLPEQNIIEPATSGEPATDKDNSRVAGA